MPLHHIRLVAGIEIRPPVESARFMLEHDQARRLSEPVADDLAACVPQATQAHLCIVGSLFEPGQILSPNRAPWNAMIEVGRLSQTFEPGVTAIGCHQGKAARDELAPFNRQPDGLFLCLPLLLGLDHSHASELETELEKTLFDQGGLKPPSLGTLHELTGLEPVHGQLMTLIDLMALTKMQLAAAGLDAFWAPVEHALLQPEQPFNGGLPAELNLQWSTDQQRFEIEFLTFDQMQSNAQDYALWLRAFRQTTALLDTHWIDWHCSNRTCPIEAQHRWLSETGAASQGDPSRVWIQQLDGPGLVAYTTIDQGRLRHFYPLTGKSVRALQQHFLEQGKTLLRSNRFHERNGRLMAPE
ncbi:MAG: hypothetical protein AAF446_06980 [Pseudomonadota bacterium]